MKCFRFVPIIVLAAGAVVSCAVLSQNPAAAQDNSAKPDAPAASPSFDLSAIDKTADPCTDFYQYACGNWVKNNPLPSDKTRWQRSFAVVGDRNRYLLWQELDAAAKDPKTPLQKQYGDFYAACMDTDTIEKKGLTPIQPAWKAIDGLARPTSFRPCSASLITTAHPTVSSTSASDRTKRTPQSRSPKSSRAASRCPTATTILSIRRASRPSASSTSPMSPKCSPSPATRPSRLPKRPPPSWKSKRLWPNPPPAAPSCASRKTATTSTPSSNSTSSRPDSTGTPTSMPSASAPSTL